MDVPEVSNNNIDLSFNNLKEYERTKHVHRLHPYLGKFIPQLVNFFLNSYFNPRDTILDPFVGSGTTLVEASELGMNSIGIDISSFNCLISKVKTDNYDLELLEREIKDILTKTKEFRKICRHNVSFFRNKNLIFHTNSKYLNKWFHKNALRELLFYGEQIKNYTYKDVLKIILSRSARSSRLVPHFELTRAKEPITNPYYCYKHKRICTPINQSLKFLNRYSYDTIRRIKEFSKLRSNTKVKIIQGDSRHIKLNKNVDGIFTSPPYVGLINYHEQHKYAYELLGLPIEEEKEIGPRRNGQTSNAREKYQKGIIDVFRNVLKFVKQNSNIFIVVNDKFSLYPKIAENSGMEIIKVFSRPVTKKASRERTIYSESIFHMKKK